jgi:copper chaperone
MIQLSIPDMNCGHCEKAIREAVKETDPQAKIEIDLGARTARIETAQPEAVADAIAKAGYPNGPVS